MNEMNAMNVKNVLAMNYLNLKVRIVRRSATKSITVEFQYITFLTISHPPGQRMCKKSFST